MYGVELIHMSGTASIEHADTLAEWLHARPTPSRVRGHRPAGMVGRLRLAFYGRISTREYQDPASSQAWQLDSATETIAGRGQSWRHTSMSVAPAVCPGPSAPERLPCPPPSPAPPGPSQQLAAYLRAHHMTVVCHQNTIDIRQDTMTIAGAIPEPETLLQRAA